LSPVTWMTLRTLLRFPISPRMGIRDQRKCAMRFSPTSTTLFLQMPPPTT
jgi:hypothetical protein